MIIGTAGHIDHGKTALVRALTGIDTDRLKEEKARGITIELGFAYQPVDPNTPDGPRLGFVDMPGHERFIPTMLAGATGIGLALLVVAADDGVMPQTREHLQILQLLNLRQGVIALTKTDAVPEERIAEVTRELRTLLAGSFLADAPLFPCSAVKGQGIDALKTFLQNAARTWHAQRSAQRIANKNFRLAVDRSFSIEGRGTIITGTVHAGALAVGDTVRLLPSNRNARPLTARVRGLHAFNQPADRCEAGERVALNLVGVERSEIHRGDWIVDEALSHRTDRLSVVVTLLPDAKPLKHWSSVHMHTGAAHTLAHIALLEGDQLSPGSSMLGELALDVPLHLCQGDRIVLRDASARQTLGGCVVVDGFPPLRGKRSEQRLALLRAQQDSDDAHALKALLAMEARGINLSAFAANRNIRPTDLPLLLAQLNAMQVPTGDGLYACLPSHWQAIQDKIVNETAQFHEREPDNAGVERERLRRKTFPTLAPEAFAAALQGLLEARTIVPAQGSFVALPTHKVEFSTSERSVWEQVLPKLTEAPYQPPRVRPLAQELGIDEAEMRRLMGKSARLGYTYRVAHDHYFLASAVKDLAAHIAALCDEQGLAKAAPFRDRIDTGRKLAIQILEFFDTIGYTRRIKEHHMIRQPQMWS
jgi:selenocysteine-specific elongation factor